MARGVGEVSTFMEPPSPVVSGAPESSHAASHTRPPTTPSRTTTKTVFRSVDATRRGFRAGGSTVVAGKATCGNPAVGGAAGLGGTGRGSWLSIRIPLLGFASGCWILRGPGSAADEETLSNKKAGNRARRGGKGTRHGVRAHGPGRTVRGKHVI
ncbi:hypothetical protein AHiyo4_47030 [Arthrobacter sp. Hiyo4]|nr:hypothetical protein AHiyo4_47030 [Arthrobacter sp. Hiyo4]